MTDPRRLTAFLLLCLACVLPLQGQDRITVGNGLPGDGPPPTTYGGMLESVPAPQITVGSKNFNEGYLLGEIVAQVLELEGFAVERKFGLGGTLVCYEALVNGAIDVYVEYTGTLAEAILKLEGPAPDLDQLNTTVSELGLQVLESLGFNNTYALAMRKDMAEAEGISRISDLANHPELKPAFSLEFLNREDGWPGLAETYNLAAKPSGIEHGLAYQALVEGSIDITDAYSTDGELARYSLAVLDDDRGYFPRYLAVPFARADFPAGAGDVIARLAGRIDDDRMQEMNRMTTIDGRSFAEVASEFLGEEGLGNTKVEDSLVSSILGNTITHLKLTAIALALGCLAGLPLGIIVFRNRPVANLTVYLAGLLQTIPSIALLALMIPVFGIGVKPAIIALFLYSLLPILRNTVTALITIDPVLKRVAEAIGLTRREQLRHVLLPMALPNILAGVRTAAVISIGTATLAAFIGAGGLGEPIVTGLALNDTGLILQGALPAAGLAILVELLFELLERLLVKPHMLKGQI
ncbi:MAG: ABC transporter permease subunit [Gammaproteobacteria bacterium]|nr:ABC transporter permease subunit [Gammaproteobacteria bacterium]